MAPTSSMVHRGGNSPLHPWGIFHPQTVPAYSTRPGQVPARGHAELDCDRLEKFDLTYPEVSAEMKREIMAARAALANEA
jgi:hypothetical protein